MMSRKQGLYEPFYEHDACGVGFIANINGDKTHAIIEDGITILANLEHRGAVGGDTKTGDGAGILLQLPHRFFTKSVDFPLPQPGRYGAGFLFLPREHERAETARKMVERVIEREQAELIGWRQVPVEPGCLGDEARKQMPSFWQLFVSLDAEPGEPFERQLYILRKALENEALKRGWQPDSFYIPSFSSRIIVYKGMFVSSQFVTFYPDLQDKDLVSAISLVHQRYSTNTFPSWFLAQPFRLIAHNGEINTLRRNINNMKARESSLNSELFGEDVDKLCPIVNPRLSDSAIFDNVLELLTIGGRSIQHAMMMMVPEAFGTKYHISQDKRAFFEYHAAIMEPWDGPAAISFSDGIRVGSLLDRNGLRPARYLITKKGIVVLASEVGVLNIPPEDILEKGQLAPGKMFLVDTERHRVIKDNEIKSAISRRRPYRHWLQKNHIELKGLLGVPRTRKVSSDPNHLFLSRQAFGYSREDLKLILTPMAEQAREPIGSMGNDTSLAVLSRRPQLLFNYFKQLFAQVTNPPIDPYRESLIMSLMSFVGRERNLLAETPEHCRQLKLSHPILTNDDMEMMRAASIKGFQICTVPILFEAAAAPGSLEQALDSLCRDVEKCIDRGFSLIILSDRNFSREKAAIPSLLAISAVHHYLVAKSKRHLAGLLIETGEAREVHHFAALIGFGASGINPYLAFETISDLLSRGYFSREMTAQEAIENYITAIKKGILKVMSKMGISTLRSYRGSQIFEAVGLNRDFIEKYFTGTPSLIGGIDINIVEQEKLAIHNRAFSPSEALDSGGIYNQRQNSVQHHFAPEAVVLLQKSTREKNYGLFKKYSQVINNTNGNLCTLRSLFKIRKNKVPLALEEVEPVESIVKRFVTSAMSLGSISREAHETLALAMNRLGARSNCGEGGENESRFYSRLNGENINSRVKQVASARFGVTSNYLVNADELQIKMAQGAKPGEGGQLPGDKVDEFIAEIRHSTPGVMLISPPPHHDIYSIEDLAQLIYDLKQANSSARVSVKLVSEVGVGTVAAGVAKGKADIVVISGGDGGTGASPLSSIMHTGTPWELGLAETQAVLVMNKLRDRIKIQVDGQIKTGRDVIIAALLGAEEFGFATTALVTMGCVMMRKCHLNTCPVGVATQNPELRKHFKGKAEHVICFLLFLAREVREYMAQMGFKHFDQLIGRVDLLEVDKTVGHDKTENLDFARLLQKPEIPKGGTLRCIKKRERDLSHLIDLDLIKEAVPALKNGKMVEIEKEIRNCHRSVGAALSAEVSRANGSRGLPDNSIRVKFTGSAGQSFGAFLAPGITFELEGETNDYLAKGLSGGRVIIYPPAVSTFNSQLNSICGNVSLFGATSGSVYINGRAGERFAVRNSGAIAVVEGIGDHGCEYMTGGRVIIIGDTGINFAAGMSGGIAYVLDRNQLFDTRCNLEMVDVEPLTEIDDQQFLRLCLEEHYKFTGSRNAARILEMWQEELPLFVKVIPVDYRAALEKSQKSRTNQREAYP